jgi:hypothetical protein
MTNLRRLGAAVFLTCVLGLTALADCPSPGQTEGPPCSAAQPVLDDSTTPGQTDGPPAASASAEVVDVVSVTEIVLDVLTLF